MINGRNCPCSDGRFFFNENVQFGHLSGRCIAMMAMFGHFSVERRIASRFLTVPLWESVGFSKVDKLVESVIVD